ncbi:MAG: methionyl-tRNA formyltransferase [Thermomicrobiales bacterium]
MKPSQERQTGLRIVTCNVEPAAFDLVTQWATDHGHQIVLVITTPGPSPRTFTGHQEIVATARHDQDILVTTRLKRAASLIAAVQPDVILSYTFPLRIPPSVLELPRLGAVNLHPSPLPTYRGPNPARMLYDGTPTLGATLHRTSMGFDTGPILSCQGVETPENPTVAEVLATWRRLLVAALDDGMERLIAGDPGDQQDNEDASYAAAFTPEEHWIDWSWTAATVQRRVTALNLLLPTAKARAGNQVLLVEKASPLQLEGKHIPGEVLRREGDHIVVAVADGAVELSVGADEAVNKPGRSGGQVLEREFVSVK